MRAALLASLLAGLATGLGSIPVLLARRLSRKLYDTLLGFSAGVMLAAAALSLLGPAMASGELAQTALGFIAGAAIVFALEKAVPHLHPHFAPVAETRSLRMGFLVAAAIAIHNIPEGAAVAVAYASQAEKLGFVVALAIAVQNIPEGLAVAVPLRAAGFSRTRAALYATATGLAEPLAALASLAALALVGDILPFALALAAGAMIFVVSDQLIPESHSPGNEKNASFAVMAGFVLVVLLNMGFR